WLGKFLPSSACSPSLGFRCCHESYLTPSYNAVARPKNGQFVPVHVRSAITIRRPQILGIEIFPSHRLCRLRLTVDVKSQNAQEASMDLELFLCQQDIDRYIDLLKVVSDGTQRRQIQNLLEEEREKAQELQRGVRRAA